MTETCTVIGHFDCGHGDGAEPTSLELVICSSQSGVDIVVNRMKQHAAGHQCFQEPALAIAVLDGRPRIVHEVKQLPEACLLFPDLPSYVQRHDERKRFDATLGRGTRKEAMDRLRQERGGA